MSEEITDAEITDAQMASACEGYEVPARDSCCQKKVVTKRDIFRFEGDKPTAINLEHVTSVTIEGNRLTFNFYSTAVYVDLADEEAAKKAFEQVLVFWVSEQQ